MTKVRHTTSHYAALAIIAETLGWDRVSQEIDKNVWHCRKLSDPDTGREISLRDAARLDAAYQRNGGIGVPLREAYDALLLSQPARFSTADDLLTVTSRVAATTGAAVSAVLDAVAKPDCPKARRMAVKEAEEGVAALLSLISALNAGETA